MAKANVNFDTPVTEIMTWDVHTINAEWSLKEAARFFLEHRFSGAPVVDESGAPVGVLSLKDIVRYTEWHLEVEEAAEDAPARPPASEIGDEELAQSSHLDRLSQITVRQVMTPSIETLPESATVGDAIEILLGHRFHRVFVTDRAGKITGVVSTLDILGWLKKHMAQDSQPRARRR